MKDKDLLKNGSGYKDPTAYKAIKMLIGDGKYKRFWNRFRKEVVNYRYERTRNE